MADAEAWHLWLAKATAALQAAKRLRNPTAVPLRSGEEAHVEFSSNDYLGLSTHPSVRAAAADAAARHGMGPRGSPLVCGYTHMHRDLELAIARLKRAEECLLTPTGFAANASVLAALARQNDVRIYSDALNHASIVDGCRLAKCPLSVYRHNDAAHLAQLAQAADEPRHVVVTDSLFSMDGDVAPFDAITRSLRETVGASRSLAVVDEAHATLCYGERGEGLAPQGFAEVSVGTLSKAAGAHGGFVTCTRDMKRYLLSTMRGLVFSTSLPVPVVAAASAALHVATGDEGDWLRRRLHRNAARLRSTLRLEDGTGTHIVPLHARGGTESAALDAAAYLAQDWGINAVPIRPPTVPVGTARVRIALSAAHTDAQVARLAMAAVECPHLDLAAPPASRL